MKKYPPLLIAILCIKFVFHLFLIHPAYDLQRDEYLHLDQAAHLAAGYLSVPPFTSINSVIISWLGASEFWVKFFPALYGALTMLIIWRMIELLKGGWYAQVLAAVIYICSAMSRINMLYQPNNVDVLSWTLVFYLLMLYIHHDRNKYLLWLGVVIGIGILNKYNIIFLITALLPACLLSPIRKVYTKKAFYLAVLITALIILPNVIWQLQHALPVIHHMKELQETQLVNIQWVGFVADQAIFFLLGFLVWVVALVALCFYAPFRPYRFIALTFLFVMCLFLYLHAKSYYSLGIYPVLLAFGSVYLEKRVSSRYVQIAYLAVLLFPYIALGNMIFPVLKPEQLSARVTAFPVWPDLRWEDGKKHNMPQDFADMLGWREIGTLAADAWKQVPAAEKPYTIIICSNYGISGAVNYYNRGSAMPAANSFNADYMYWFPEMDTIQNVIFIGTGINPRDYVRKQASGYTITGRINNPLSRSDGVTCSLCKGMNPAFADSLKVWILEEQASVRAWKWVTW